MMAGMPVEVRGTVAPGFGPVKDAFVRAFAELGEEGAAVSAYADGERVVDLWGGEAGPGEPWTEDTIVHLYSVTKPFAAACVLRLIDEGRIELDTKVAEIWPAFAAAGKEAVPVRWLLTHESGLMGIRERLPAQAIFDHDRIAAALAAEEPWWEPGTAHGEHAYFYGHLLGEIVRRVDGRTLGTFLREEICGPLEADVHVGLRPEDEARCATERGMTEAWQAAMLGEPRSPWRRAIGNPPGALDPQVVNSSAWRRAEIPAINGHGSARGVARFYGALAMGGELDGVRVLSEPIVRQAASVQADGPDRLLGEDAQWGFGFAIEGTTFGMGGLGGSLGYGDLERRFGFAYVTALMAEHDRADLVAEAFERRIDARRSRLGS
jgi:CubicO group peptidase (beta-lactamase class C family)